MASNDVLLEICAGSLDDAEIAEASGADRIELNSALPLGGLTPSAGSLNLVLDRVSIPVIAMARPRESGFCYSENEFKTLLDDIKWLAESGVAGIAFGVLDDQGRIETDRCRQIVDLIGTERQSVFHRAFDLVSDQSSALESVIDCGICRVMTSGGRTTAWEGRHRIRDLVRQSADRIEVMAAGGIRNDHATQLVAEAGVVQVHAGLGESLVDGCYSDSAQVSFYSPPPENPASYRRNCGHSIRQMRKSLD